MDNVLRNPLILPEDLLVLAVAELPEEVRRKLGDGGEEFALTRPLAREPSKLIDAAAARLIEQFRQPRTIVQAVISYCRAHDADPERTLEDSLPLLRQLLGSGLLLPEGAAEARRIEATYATGALVGAFRILRCVQVLDDSELYQARDLEGAFVALKIARVDGAVPIQRRLNHEAAALQRLAGIVSPRFREEGVFDGRPFLVTEWIRGIDAVAAAADLRELGTRDALLKLLVEIVRAYASIHQFGVLHGDVHPGNILVGPSGAITLIDFGLAHLAELSSDTFVRGGVGFFMEPEYAREVLNQRPSPAPTREGEQFAIGALLYMLATGQHYMDFTLEQEEMFRQIRDAAPLPFSERGVEPWPDLEAVLRRSLSVAPEARYGDMAQFAQALTSIDRQRVVSSIHAADHAQKALLNETISYIGLDSELYRAGLGAGPLCSVNFGSSGVAYALYRLACQRDEPRLLAAADAWIVKAQAEAPGEIAFSNPAMDLTEATVGRVSPYHARPGMHLVQALIAQANGESATRDAATRAFMTGIDTSCVERDLCLGRSGTVLGCVMLLEILRNSNDALAEELRCCGAQRLSALWDETAIFDSIDQGQQWPNLGIAHGWAGLLYVTLRWHALTGTPMPPTVHERLAQLMDCAQPSGRGVMWPWRQNPNDDYLASMPGWCNGSAGIVHLACIAHRLLGDDRLVELAEAAAWHSWEAGEGPVDLCCGYAGRAYALLEMYRSTGDAAWHHRARALAHRAVHIAPHMRTAEHPRHSLYKGELGLALLIADLERPQSAAMPMFGSEG
jgi:eukaryotic-like serine/threonine-protein kinase